MAFETPAVEEHFLRGRHGILLQNTSRLAACAVLPYLATFAKGASDWSELNIQEKLACSSALLGVALGVLFAVLPTIECYQRHMGPGRSELLIVAVLMYILCDSLLGVSSLLQSLRETHAAGQLEGPRDTRAHDADVGVFKCALGLGAVLRARGCTPELVQSKLKSSGKSLRLPHGRKGGLCAGTLASQIG